MSAEQGRPRIETLMFSWFAATNADERRLVEETLLPLVKDEKSVEFLCPRSADDPAPRMLVRLLPGYDVPPDADVDTMFAVPPSFAEVEAREVRVGCDWPAERGGPGR